MSRLRYLTAGESHGPGLVAILEGLPAGLPVAVKSIADELTRRRHGYGRGPRMKIEKDALEIMSGVRAGLTLGSPLAIVIRNTEWEKWEHVMPVEGEPGGRPLTRPRPGHADLPGMLKYDFDDARNVLERASARETAARVAIAAVAKTFSRRSASRSSPTWFGSDRRPFRRDRRPRPRRPRRDRCVAVRCFDPEAESTRWSPR